MSNGIGSAGLEFDYIWLLDVVWLGRHFRAACCDLATPLDYARTLWMMNPSLHSAVILVICVIWMKISLAPKQSILSSGMCLIMNQSTCLYLWLGSFYLHVCVGATEPPRKRKNSLNNSLLSSSWGPSGYSTAEEKLSGWSALAAQPRPTAHRLATFDATYRNPWYNK